MALILRDSFSGTLALAKERQFIGPGRSVHELSAFLGRQLEGLGNKLCNRAGHDPLVLAGRIEQLFGSSLEDRQLKLDVLYKDEAQMPKLRQLCIKLLNFAWPSSSPETQCLTFEKIILLATRYPGLRRLLCDHKRLSNSADDIANNWKRQDCESGKEWDFYREFAAFCLQSSTLSGIVEKSKPSLLGRVGYDSLASGGDSSNLNLVPLEELLIFSRDGPAFNVLRLAATRYVAGILELPSFWDCKNVQKFHEVLKNICRTTLMLIADADFDFDNDNPQETYPWMSASFDSIDALARSLIIGLTRLDPTRLRLPDINELLKQLSRPESQSRFPNAVHSLNSNPTIGYLLQSITLTDLDPIDIPYVAPAPSGVDSLLLPDPVQSDDVVGNPLEEAAHLEALAGSFPDDLDINNLPAEYKTEGTNWVAIFNPKQKRVLDMRLVHTLKHESVVCCVRFSADGKYLATGCNRSTQIYDVATGALICVLVDETPSTAGDSYVRSVCFSPDSKYLATGAEDKQIRIWDIPKRCIRNVFDGHQERIYSLDFSHDGRFIVSGSADATVRIWDMLNGSVKVLIIRGPGTGVVSVAISPNGQLLAAGSLDTVVRIWDVPSGTLIERLLGHTNSVYSVAFTPDGKGLVSGSFDKTLKYWDVSGLLGVKARKEATAVGHATVESPAGKGEIGEKVSPYTMNFTGHKDYVLSVVVSPDGRWVVSGSRDCGIQFWDSETAAVQCRLQGHKNSVISVDLSLGGNLLATGSGDQEARIWAYSSL